MCLSLWEACTIRLLTPTWTSRSVEKFYVKYATEELHECVRFCEKHTGKKMDWDRLEAVVDLSDKTWDLFIDTYDLRKAMPTPMDTGDAMNTMVPLYIHARDPGGL